MEKSKINRSKSEFFITLCSLCFLVALLFTLNTDFSKTNRVLNRAEIVFNYDNLGDYSYTELSKSTVKMDLGYNLGVDHTVTVAFRNGLKVIFRSLERREKNYYESKHRFFDWTYEVKENPQNISNSKAKRLALKEIKRAIQKEKEYWSDN